MTEINKALAESAAQRTNLKVSTCVDLLTSGWTYLERIDGIPLWLSSAARIEVGK